MEDEDVVKDVNENILKPERDPEVLMEDDLDFTDHDWIADAFMVKSEDLDEPYDLNRFMSVTDNKFTDTSMGGNISINCYPQFTRYADIRSAGVLNGRNPVRINDLRGNIGMGRYYGEAIDDNSTNVYFEFGVPQFNNVLFYLLGAVDYKTSVIANSGRSPIFYNAGYIFGTGALMLAFPIIGPALLIGKFLFNMATNIAASPGKFSHYYLKPTMFMYWSTVNSLVTMMATELGIISPIFMDDKKDPDKVGIPLKLDDEEMDALREIMPGIITTGNAINVHAMVARSQILYNKMHDARLKSLSKLADAGVVDDEYRDNAATVNIVEPKDLWKELKPVLQKDKNFDGGSKSSTMKDLLADLKTDASQGIEDLLSKDGDGRYERSVREEDKPGRVSSFLETTKAVFNEGARFSVFRVEHIGSVSESFSNSTTSVDIGNTINSLGSKWRSFKFNVGGGEIPVVGDAMKAIFDFGVGALDGVTLGLSNTIASFLSGANVDIPKRWENSTANMPKLSFKMTLISPTAHPVAQLRNIHIPLAAIMAGVLPLATGPKSYTSPYICSMFVRGYQRISLGMITSLSITRGVSNLPFNKQRRPLAVDVTFTVTDFSELISAPVVNDLLSTSNIAYDDESGISRYIQALCARDLYTTVHVMDKAKIKLSRVFQEASLMTTGEYWGAKVGDTLTNTSIFSVMSDKKAVSYSEMY